MKAELKQIEVASYICLTDSAVSNKRGSLAKILFGVTLFSLLPVLGEKNPIEVEWSDKCPRSPCPPPLLLRSYTF